MLIDIKNLAGVKRDIDCSDKLFFNRSGIKVPAEVELKGTVYKDNSSYIVDGKVNAVLELKCDLCLSPTKLSLEIPFNEVFSAEQPDEEPDDEIWVLSDEEVRSKKIDADAAVTADILLNLPMRVLCSDNCRGLCPKCGHNLNDGDCGCDRTYRNPQFEMLLDLFKDEDDNGQESDE